MTALIRKMTGNDLDQVMEIEYRSFPLPWSRGSFEREICYNNYSCYIVAGAGENGQVTGYAGSWVFLDEAHITTLAVHPLYRRTGTGSALFSYLLETAHAQGAERVLLEVRDSNEAARRLYEKHGFTVIGRRKKYYFDEDALVMARYFQPAGSEESR